MYCAYIYIYIYTRGVVVEQSVRVVAGERTSDWEDKDARAKTADRSTLTPPHHDF